MKRTIGVFLGDAGRRIGALRFDSQGARQSAAFAYDHQWLAASDRFALEPDLPLVTGAQFHKPRGRDASIFHGAIADTEPDGWARRVILRDHAKRRALARAAGEAQDHQLLTPIDFLLAVDDVNRVGALRFQDEEGVFQRAAGEGQRTAPRLRPKCSVIDADGALSIGKFPSIEDERAVTKGEVLAMQLAKAAGINAPQARLIDSGGIPVTLIRRFVGAPTEHTYTEIVDAIRQHGADAQADIEELGRRIAFSILINNVDDHLHNHGFTHVAKDQWRLSPAFDLNPFPDRQRELRTWISEEASPAASIDALMAVAAYFKLDKEAAVRERRG